MPHDTPLIATIVGGLCLAFIFGAIANRLKIPPLVGYLLAGVLAGPYTPGFIADQSLAPQLAEIGVILLMFGVGLHFSLKDLLSVRAIAVPGAIVQISAATALGAGLAWILGWTFQAGLVFGLALSTASTVVLLRAMQERRLIETERGRIAVGWLIVEDLAMVLALVLLPALNGALSGKPTAAMSDPLVSYLGLGIWGVVGLTLAKVVAFVAIMLIVGRRVIPWTLHAIAHTGSRELFRLAVLAIALGVAFGSAKLFGVSLALGAFFAGMIMSESELSHRAAEESLPLRDAFAVLFFVSVGMLFDPSTIINDPLPLLATVLIIVVGKSLAAFFIVTAFGYPAGTALTISASLAQIGEFSFILAELGVGLDMLPPEGRDLILGGAILSILLNPLVFAGVEWIKPAVEKRLPRSLKARSEQATQEPVVETVEKLQPTELSNHVILIGYGRVGSLVGQSLKEIGQAFLVIEDSDKIIARLRDEDMNVIPGNGAMNDVLEAANIAGASQLILAIPNAFEAGQIVFKARAVNPAISILARAHSDAEVQHLQDLGADAVVMGEREIARGIVAHILENCQKLPATAGLADEPDQQPQPQDAYEETDRKDRGEPMTATQGMG
ncbi:MAG: YbaL family putative K(+) efflux transporter [Phyllobacterium sp.]